MDHPILIEDRVVDNRATVRSEHHVNPAVAALKRDRIAVIVVILAQVAAHGPGTVQIERERSRQGRPAVRAVIIDQQQPATAA